MEQERRVDMVRLPRREEVFDREEVLGRDASSVFPTEVRAQAAAAAAAAGNAPLDANAIKEALGARKFISESELESLKSLRGRRVEDGSVNVDKPLVVVLAEAKAKKEADFQEKWKMMKTGKNRPLDAEEFEFLDTLMRQEAERESQWTAQQRQELEEFRRAVEQAAKEKQAEGPLPVAAAQPQKAPTPKVEVNKVTAVAVTVKPMVKVRPKQGSASDVQDPRAAAKRQKLDSDSAGPSSTAHQPSSSNSHQINSGQQQQQQQQESVMGAVLPGTQQQQQRQQQQQTAESADEGGEVRLTSLLGDYGSDSDKDT